VKPEYYAAFKKKEVLTQLIKWINPEDTGIRQPQKDKYRMILPLFIYLFIFWWDWGLNSVRAS
jgi:hypothetical protein